MVLHDLLHDGKSEAGAFWLVSDIRFREAGAIFLGKADTSVGYRDSHVFIHHVHREPYLRQGRGIGPHGDRERSERGDREDRPDRGDREDRPERVERVETADVDEASV